jgi:hypothetical protein
MAGRARRLDVLQASVGEPDRGWFGRFGGDGSIVGLPLSSAQPGESSVKPAATRIDCF